MTKLEEEEVYLCTSEQNDDKCLLIEVLRVQDKGLAGIV